MKGSHSGAKGSESAIAEGLKDKSKVSVKNDMQPHGKAQRPKKGSDRA